VPEGFRQQVAACKVQKMLRGYLARKQVQSYLRELKYCPMCHSFAYLDKEELRTHMEVRHENQFRTLVKSLITVGKQRSEKNLNMPLQKPSVIKKENIRHEPPAKPRPESAGRSRRTNSIGKPIMEVRKQSPEDADFRAQQTPIKDASPH
jgi:myosin heavy subunit